MAERELNRRSRRTRDDDVERTEDPPRRGRGRSRDPEPEEDAPRGRRSRRDSDEDEAPRGRRSRRDDSGEDGDEREPRSSRRSRDEDEPPRSRNTSKGWGGYKEKREETSDYVKNYRLPEKQEEIIKILDSEPFSIYAEHWLEDKKGKKSYVCPGKDVCPLCKIGDKPRVYSLFNVLDLREDEEPTVYPWKVSQTVTDVLEGYAKSDRTSPIDREDLYFSIRKTGGGQKGKVQTHINPVKARDLKEDWDIEPFTSDELADYVLYEENDVLEFTSIRTLRDIADDLD